MRSYLSKALRLFLFVFTVVDCSLLFGQEKVNYVDVVKPLLIKHCYKCHSQLEQEGDFRADSIQAILEGGSQGPAVVAGDAEKSLLIGLLRGKEDMIMPVEGEPLSETEIQIFVDWINQGAVGDDQDAVRQHWAFQKPTRADKPSAATPQWSKTEIDYWIHKKHKQLGVVPVAKADRRTLVRRAYLDLIGLPPTEDQIQKFLKDKSSNAFAKVIDGLLESERYGERWGRHWMDVWRYSDWSGYRAEVRNSRKNIWQWRDWIIQSLNEDAGYDHMVAMMLAADELAPEDPNALRATGYLARSWYKFNRNTWLDKTIEHSSKAFLGLTIGCAKCHDHIYDPIPQAEYYRFRAIFEPHDIRDSSLLDGSAFPRVFDKDLDAKTFVFARGDDRKPIEDELMKPGLPAFLNANLNIRTLKLPAEAWYPGVQKSRQQAEHNRAKKELEAAKKELATTEKQLALATSSEQKEIAKKSNEQDKTVLLDQFDSMDEKTWKVLEGDWHAKDGKAIQSKVGATTKRLRLLKKYPQNFELKIKATILGGEKWKSFGFDFDSGEDRSLGFYVSAVKTGSKIQFVERKGSQTEYRQDGTVPHPFQTNKEFEIRFLVAGQLANVFIDGEFLKAVNFKSPRAEGVFDLWAFDCHVAVESFELRSLSDASLLALPGDSKQALPTVEDAKQSLEIAQLKLDEKQKQLEFVIVRNRALTAKYGDNPGTAAEISKLNRSAYAAEQKMKLAAEKLSRSQAKSAKLQAEKKFSMSNSDANKKALTAATNKLREAQKKLEAQEKIVEEAQWQESFSPLGEQFPANSTGRRAALARWITSKSNPLTTRVAVNHIWLRHFGKPLVPSVFEFGLNGQKPTHPELLDYLAVELMENQWSMKHIHRLIMNSRVYQLKSSAANTSTHNQKLDPDNQSLWRMNSRRMEAEVIRDSVLHVSGELDLTMGGPEIPFAQGMTNRRRSVYFQTAYEKQMTFLKLFDIANPEECYERKDSIVPQQALAMANSPLTRRQARVLTGKIIKTEVKDKSPEKFIKLAFRKTLGRDPEKVEMQTCQDFINRQMKKYDSADLSSFDSNMSVDIPPSNDTTIRAFESLMLVLMNHNEFITIR